MTDLAFLITAIGGFIAVTVPAFVVLRRELRVTSKVVDATHVLTQHIDHAVNGKPLGAQTLQNQIGKMYEREFPPPVNGDGVLPLLRQMAETLTALSARFPEK